jgi:hypothetical protein
MKRLYLGLCVLALLSMISLLPPVLAQAAERTAGPLAYDVSKEVTFNATVSSVPTKGSLGMQKGSRGKPMGSHLLLSTTSGPVDASLGRFALLGKGALKVAPGQQIEVTGVMKTLKDKQVFLVRTVKAGGQTYTIRTKRGFLVSPQSRERAAQKGESL